MKYFIDSVSSSSVAFHGIHDPLLRTSRYCQGYSYRQYFRGCIRRSNAGAQENLDAATNYNDV